MFGKLNRYTTVRRTGTYRRSSVHAFEISVLNGVFHRVRRTKRPGTCGSTDLKFTGSRQTKLRKFPELEVGWWDEEGHHARMILRSAFSLIET